MKLVPRGVSHDVPSLTLSARIFRRLMLPVCLLTIAGTAACSRADKRLPYPHESVLSALAELKIQLRSDPYREEAGRDLEGQNIFRATLLRMDSIDELTGVEYDDILAFARAECHERLGDWTGAAERFKQVAEAGTSLSEEAGIRLIWVNRFREAIRQPPSVEDLEDYLDYLDAQIVQFEQLRRSGPIFPYDSYIMIELERVLEQKAAFLFTNRIVITEGAKRGLEVGQQLLTEHAASHRIGEHELTVGWMNEALARDYMRMNPPQGGGFDADAWVAWVDAARELYAKAAQRDGDPAKPEAQARLRVVEAMAARSLQRAR